MFVVDTLHLHGSVLMSNFCIYIYIYIYNFSYTLPIFYPPIFCKAPTIAVFIPNLTIRLLKLRAERKTITYRNVTWYASTPWIFYYLEEWRHVNVRIRFGGKCRLHLQVERISKLANFASYCCAVPSLLILSTLMTKAICSSETSVLTRPTAPQHRRWHFP
jgi:hypothetical protein